MKRILKWGVLFLLGWSIVSGCNPPTSGNCTPGDLVTPQITTPAGSGVLNYLDWDPAAGVVAPGVIAWDFSADCTPDAFVVEFYHHDLHVPMHQERLPGTANSWPQSQINEPFFEPNQHYLVHVYAVAQGENSEYAAKGIWTEPRCTSASQMMEPVVFGPENGAIVREPVIFHYEQPAGGCVPSGYVFQLTTSPSKTVPDVEDSVYPFPGTFLIYDEGHLTPCTPYFWRVAPVYEGIYGPFTPYRVFQVQGDDVACLPYSFRPLEGPDIPRLLPCASVDQLGQPELLTPEFMGYIGTQAVDGLYVGLFTWQYTGTCSGDGYHLEIMDSLDEDHPVVSVDTTDTSWPPSGSTVTALAPATKYYWQVAATLNGEQGPVIGSVFFTGPRCTDPQEALPPVPVSPADGAIITTPDVTIEWNWSPQTCLPQGIVLEVSADPAFSGGMNDMHLYPLATEAARLNTLEDCTVYYWRVSTYVVPPYSDLIPSLPSETRWFMMADNPVVCRLPRLPGVSFQRLACWQGPGPAYPLVMNLQAGEQFFVTGRSEDGNWLVASNESASWQCWASASGIEVRGPITALDIIAPPPVPSEPSSEPPPDSGGSKPPACSYNLPKDQCEAAGGSWYTGLAAGPHCVCPYP